MSHTPSPFQAHSDTPKGKTRKWKSQIYFRFHRHTRFDLIKCSYSRHKCQEEEQYNRSTQFSINDLHNRRHSEGDWTPLWFIGGVIWGTLWQLIPGTKSCVGGGGSFTLKDPWQTEWALEKSTLAKLLYWSMESIFQSKGKVSNEGFLEGKSG